LFVPDGVTPMAPDPIAVLPRESLLTLLGGMSEA
jgi:hypothetical protein